MLITYPVNVDYLIDDIRLRVADLSTTSPRFTDNVIRTAIINAVGFLSRRWGNRYLAFKNERIVQPPEGYMYASAYAALSGEKPVVTVIPEGYLWGILPEGYGSVPSGLLEGDVFRNTNFVFSSQQVDVFTDEDTEAVILATILILASHDFWNTGINAARWRDFEVEYSTIQAAQSMKDIYMMAAQALDVYFKKKLHAGKRMNQAVTRIEGMDW